MKAAGEVYSLINKHTEFAKDFFVKRMEAEKERI
jgi:hypothetical protein